MPRHYTPRKTSGGGNFLSPYVVTRLRGLLSNGGSERGIATELDISTNSVQRYRRIMKAEGIVLRCGCGALAGHRGWCAVRLTRSEARQEFLKRWGRWRTPPLVRVSSLDRRVVLAYPYLDSGTISRSDLLTTINSIVPHGLPEHIRADVCQEMIVDILCGELALSDAAVKMRRYIGRAWGDSYKVVSLDAPIRGTDNLRLIDTIEDTRPHF